jgi:3-oxoacyl-[acyl-carrier-protein] synthase-3
MQYIKMQGQEVFRRAVRVVVDSALISLERAGITTNEIDWFIPHQANLRIIEAGARRLKIPMDKTIVNIDKYGNTSAASIPLALAEAADSGKIKSGDRILLSGFGAGMTWGSAVIEWGSP